MSTLYIMHIVVKENETTSDESGNLSIIRATKIITVLRSVSRYPNISPRVDESGALTTTRNVSNITKGTIGRTRRFVKNAYRDTVPNVYITYGSVTRYAASVVVIISLYVRERIMCNLCFIPSLMYTIPAVARNER